MPFEPSKPKEFPDAIIISASIKYFTENHYDEVIAISNDKGFSMGIKEHTKFRVESDIVNIMQELLNIKDTEIWNCKNYIINNNILNCVNTYKIESVDEHDYFDVSDIIASINDFQILDKNDNNYFICVNCNLDLIGDFKIIDQEMTIYDNEDPECDAIFYTQGSKIHIDGFDVFISLPFDKKHKIFDYEVVEVDTINLSEYFYQLTLIH